MTQIAHDHVTFSAKLPRSFDSRVRTHARKMGVSRMDLIRVAVHEYLERKEGPAKGRHAT